MEKAQFQLSTITQLRNAMTHTREMFGHSMQSTVTKKTPTH